MCGEDTEDSWHIWDNCPGFKQQRKEAMKKLEESSITYEKVLLEFFGNEIIQDILKTNEVIIER